MGHKCCNLHGNTIQSHCDLCWFILIYDISFFFTCYNVICLYPCGLSFLSPRRRTGVHSKGLGFAGGRRRVGQGSPRVGLWRCGGQKLVDGWCHIWGPNGWEFWEKLHAGCFWDRWRVWTVVLVIVLVIKSIKSQMLSLIWLSLQKDDMFFNKVKFWASNYLTGEPQQLPAVLISPNDITMSSAVCLSWWRCGYCRGCWCCCTFGPSQVLCISLLFPYVVQKKHVFPKPLKGLWWQNATDRSGSVEKCRTLVELVCWQYSGIIPVYLCLNWTRILPDYYSERFLDVYFLWSTYAPDCMTFVGTCFM